LADFRVFALALRGIFFGSHDMYLRILARLVSLTKDVTELEAKRSKGAVTPQNKMRFAFNRQPVGLSI